MMSGIETIYRWRCEVCGRILESKHRELIEVDSNAHMACHKLQAEESANREREEQD